MDRRALLGPQPERRRGYADLIDQQIALTCRLAAGVADLPGFELLGDVQTAVCCFRYLPPEIRTATEAVSNTCSNRW